MKTVFINLSLFTSLMAFANSTPTPTPTLTRQNGKIVGSGTTPIKIELTHPKGGWTHDQMVAIAGTVSDTSVDPITVNINGDKYLLRTFNGAFKRKFPVANGKNSIIVIATNKAGTFKEERTLYAKVPNHAITTILTSDTDGVYTDLHVYEPDPSAVDINAEPKHHIYWASTTSTSGGQFYLNEQGGDFDQPGYGPYLYTHKAPPLGIYRVDANYWPSGDKAHTVGTLNLVLFPGTPNEKRRRVRQALVTPGETVTLAFFKIQKNQQVSIYIPGVDAKPKDNKIWPQWVIDAPLSVKSKADFYD